MHSPVETNGLGTGLTGVPKLTFAVVYLLRRSPVTGVFSLSTEREFALGMANMVSEGRIA
jgi:hypothetical protein